MTDQKKRNIKRNKFKRECKKYAIHTANGQTTGSMRVQLNHSRKKTKFFWYWIT